MKNSIVLLKSKIHTGDLVLVNKQYPFQNRKDIAAFLQPVPDVRSKIMLNKKVANLLDRLVIDINDCWTNIRPVSGWRSESEQSSIFTSSLTKNGKKFTESYVALPGHSEHQTGLAVDLSLRGEKGDSIRPGFPNSGVCLKFRERMADYGFIERYPAGKEKITEIAYEPWHFRYVGTPHSLIIKKMNFTLEEYIEFLKDFSYGERNCVFEDEYRKISISFLKSQGAATELFVDSDKTFTVSGNNHDGFIITRWES